MTDLSTWLAYDPRDEKWDIRPATSLLDMKTQAELIILRYRDHHAPKTMDRHLSAIAEAIRNLPCESS